MSFVIQGLGTATPPGRIRQADAAEIARQFGCETEQQGRLLQALYRRAGVKTRHSVVLEPCPAAIAPTCLPVSGGNGLPDEPDTHAAVTQSFFEPALSADDCGPTTTQRMQMYERHAPALARQAVVAALEQAAWAPNDITHLITVSCTGFSAPGVDLSLIRECGLNPDIQRTQLGFMGCHGAINGLRVAQAYAEASPKARVLLCAVELCSLHQQYGWHPDRIVSNALFADGAAAVVGSQTAAGSVPWRVVSTASTVIPDTADLMSWAIRDHGFEMSLSPEVPETIRQQLRPWLSQWLATQGLTLGEIGSWAVHPGGPRILRACEQALELESNQLQFSHEILAEFGNMSSPTVLFILQRLRQQRQPLPCVMLAFGPGLCIEAALLGSGTFDQ